MDGASWKQIEGQRVQQVLSAIGALPAAMLVFGDGPATTAAGAPLFLAAIGLIVGSLMCWNYTDGVFYLDSVEMDDREGVAEWRERLSQEGYRFQYRTYGYGIASLLASALGVAGVYSSVRSSISIEVGLVFAVMAIALVSFDIVRLGVVRNKLLADCRALQD